MKLLLQAWHANSGADWGTAALIAMCTLLVLIVARHVAEYILKKTAARKPLAKISAVPAALVASTRLWLLIPLALYAGASAVELPAKLDRGLDKAVAVALMIQAAFWINALVNLWLTGEIDKRKATDRGDAVTALALMHFVLRVVVWTLMLLVILNHLNFNVSALLTGLGVGGVAVALAVQNVLGDLFASLSIVLDKPFVVGDFIIVDAYMGSVENIGLKTTRIRSLSGELIIFSNGDLLKSRVRNYKRMFERRVAFNVNVAYGASTEQLEAIPGFLRQAIEKHSPIRFSGTHFKEYGESALVFEAVYYVLSPDNDLYMDIQQKINLDIHRYFAANGLDFAHPMRTLQVNAGAAVPVMPVAPPKEASNEAKASGEEASGGDAQDNQNKAEQGGNIIWTKNATA